MTRGRKPAPRGERPAHIELEAWMERSRQDPDLEPAFFRRLLEATVYAHVPISDDSDMVRLVQFRHPDGFYAIPFFTSPHKAQIAGSRAVRIAALRGRELLTATRGAILMLNPNDGGAVLYPEEIAVLLDTGVMARVQKIEYTGLHVRAASNVPPWFEAAVRASVENADFVAAAYILESHPTERWDTPPGLLIYLVVNPAMGERAARLVTGAVQSRCADLQSVVDVMIHDASTPLPEHLKQPGIFPVFARDAAASVERKR